MDNSLVKSIAFLALWMFGYCSYAQDPAMSQHYASANYLNPSSASESDYTNFTAVVRTYTNSNYEHYSLYSASFVKPFRLPADRSLDRFNHQSAYDVLMYHEETSGNGRMAKSNLLLGFAHKIQLANTHYLNVGVQGGAALLQASDGFQWGSEYDDVSGYVHGSSSVAPEYAGVKTYALLNAGVLWSFKNSDKEIYMRKFPFDCFFGISASNINSPNYSLFETETVNLPMLIKFHGGVQWYASNFISLYPNFIYSNQEGMSYFDVGTYAYFGYGETAKNVPLNFVLGAWYRKPDVGTVLCGFVLNRLQLGVSHDISFGNSIAIGERGASAVELTAKYLFKSDKEGYKRGYSYPAF